MHIWRLNVKRDFLLFIFLVSSKCLCKTFYPQPNLCAKLQLKKLYRLDFKCDFAICVYTFFAYETNMIILTIYLINETYFLCHFLAYSSQWTQKLACNEIWMLTYTCWTVTCIVLFSIWRRKFYFCHNSHKIRQNWIIHLFKHN